MVQTATDPPKDPKVVDPQILKDCQEALKIAKITMMMSKNTMFYTTILFSMKQIINYEMPTAAIDGKRLWINPEFFLNETPTKRIGLLSHEVLHVGLDHMHRIGDRDPKIWNMAGDYVINIHLHDAGYDLPDCRLLDHAYRGKSTEEVYDILKKKSDEQLQNLMAKNGMGGDVQYPEQADPNDPNKTPVPQDEVTDLIIRASIQAKNAQTEPGAIPGEVGIELERILNPPLPWNLILQHHMNDYAKDDYTFRRPNKRFMPDTYMPVAFSEAVGHVAVICDASCSVDDYAFNSIVTKIEEIMLSVSPKKLTVVTFDTTIKSVQELNQGDNPFQKLKMHGRGGTQIAPVLEWINQAKPEVALIFTDGEFAQKEPLYKRTDMVWLIYDNKRWKSKFGGRVIYFDIER